MIISLPVLIGLTIILFGGCAFMTGQALAGTWRPSWQVIPYTLMLGAADRFLGFALFGGDLLSLAGWLFDSTILVAIGLLSYRLTQARRMAAQYPWLYIRTGLFSLRRL